MAGHARGSRVELRGRAARLPLLIALGALVLATAAPAAAVRAAAVPSGPPWAVSAPGGLFSFVVAPGASSTAALTLVNNQAQPQTLNIYAADLLRSQGGGYAPSQADQTPTGPGAWLAVQSASVTVPPDGTAADPFTVSVPAGTAGGQYGAAIVAAVPAASSGGGVSVTTRSALVVDITVPYAASSVSAGQAATVSTPSGAVSLSVPSGAFAHAVQLSISAAAGAPGAAPLPPGPGGAQALVPAVEVVASGGGSGSGTGAREPAKPVTISMALPAGSSGAHAFVFTLNPTLAAWIALPTSVQDGRLVAAVNHLSTFAAFADPGLVQFSDMAGNWAAAPVLALESLGVVSGFPNGTYRPNDPVSRAQFAKLLAAALRLPPGAPSALKTFSDAAAIPSWAGAALAAVVKAGLIQGNANGTLDPGGPITRVAAALIVSRALHLGSQGKLSFHDASRIPSWGLAGVQRTALVGLVKGYPDHTFRPLQPVTRAQAAALLLRVMEYSRGA